MGGRKRAANQAALDNDLYEVEHIVAKRMVRGDVQYLIHWKGYDAKDDSWEPLSNLAGMEQDVSAFEMKQLQENEAFA